MLILLPFFLPFFVLTSDCELSQEKKKKKKEKETFEFFLVSGFLDGVHFQSGWRCSQQHDFPPDSMDFFEVSCWNVGAKKFLTFVSPHK